MATSVFTQCDGAVYTVKINCANEAASIFKITFDNKMLSVPVTGFSVEQGTNVQFLHTINNFIYTYVFGDRIGELIVSGIGFIKPACRFGPFTASGSMCELNTFYQENRVSNPSKMRAMSIALGECGAFWGFLTGMRLGLPRADVLVGQWSLRFQVLKKPD